MLPRSLRPVAISLFALISLSLAGGAAATVVITQFPSPPSPNHEPRLVHLGDLPGDRERATPVAVSVDGRIVVGNGTSDAGPEAFRAVSGSGPVGLGDLPGGSFFSRATDASSDAGVIAGVSASADGVVPFRWTATTGMQPVVPSPAGAGCLVLALTAAGDAMTGVCETPWPGLDAPLWQSGWIWTEARGFAWLTGPPWLGTRSAGLDLTADGRGVVGWVQEADSESRSLVRFEAGPDGAFGSGDELRLALGIALRPAPATDLVHASADAGVALGIGLRDGGPFAFRWAIGPDGIAGSADDVIADVSRRGTSARCLATGISDDGKTPIGVCQAPGQGAYPVRWTRSKGWLHLGNAPAGSRYGFAVAASATGRAIVGFFEVVTSASKPFTAFKPFRWTAAGGISVFRTRSPEWFCDRCIAVSADGNDVVGAEGSATGDGLFAWVAGAGRRHVSDLSGHYEAARATALSRNGHYVGGVAIGSGGDRPFRSFDGGSPSAIGGPFRRHTDVLVSDTGGSLVAVEEWDVSITAARDSLRARFVDDDWTPSVTQERLGPGFAGSSACYPRLLSSDGEVVTGDCSAGYQFPAFRWTKATGILPLPVPTDQNDWACSASGMSRLGDVVALTCRRPIFEPTTESRGLIWRTNGAPLADVGAFGDAPQVELRALSDDGKVALGRATGSVTRPFIWQQLGGLRSLAASPWPDGADALDLAPSGEAAVFQILGLLQTWSPLAGVRPVPSPYAMGLGVVSEARISGNGSVVAAMYREPGPCRGPHLPPRTRVWLADPIGGGRWLEDALDAAGIDHTGWSLERVIALSYDGRRLLGHGIAGDGKLASWLVVLP